MSRHIIPAITLALIAIISAFAAVFVYDFFPELLAIAALVAVIGSGAYAFRSLS